MYVNVYMYIFVCITEAQPVEEEKEEEKPEEEKPEGMF